MRCMCTTSIRLCVHYTRYPLPVSPQRVIGTPSRGLQTIAKFSSFSKNAPFFTRNAPFESSRWGEQGTLLGFFRKKNVCLEMRHENRWKSWFSPIFSFDFWHFFLGTWDLMRVTQLLRWVKKPLKKHQSSIQTIRFSRFCGWIVEMTSNSKVFIICLAQFFERSFGNVEFDARHTAASMSEKTIEKESILKPDHPFECRDFLLCVWGAILWSIVNSRVRVS